MNASEIVTKKQQATLYRAYYQPTVYQSTTFSTLNTVSSIIRLVSSGIPITSTSYTSCLHTVYQNVCEPTFLTYHTRHAIESGAAACMGKTPSMMEWKANQPTTVYAFSTIYSTLVAPSTLAPSSIRITSTTIQTAPSPLICPLVQVQQGPAPPICHPNTCSLCP